MSLRVKDQIYEGTQAVYTADLVGDQMRVRAMVVVGGESEDDGPAVIRKAVNKYFEADEEEGNPRFFSPGHANLPVQRVTGRQIARNLVELNIDYGGRGVVGAGTTVASFSSITLPTTVFTVSSEGAGGAGNQVFSSGLPFGRFINGSEINTKFTAEEVNELRTRQFPRSAVRIEVDKTTIGSNPLQTYGDNIRTTNNGTITVAGFSCQAGTLLLEGLRSTATTFGTVDPAGQTPSTQLRYDYKLSLIYDHNGFPEQAFDPAAGGSDDEEEFQIVIRDQYRQTTWTL